MKEIVYMRVIVLYNYRLPYSNKKNQMCFDQSSTISNQCLCISADLKLVRQIAS